MQIILLFVLTNFSILFLIVRYWIQIYFIIMRLLIAWRERIYLYILVLSPNQICLVSYEILVTRFDRETSRNTFVGHGGLFICYLAAPESPAK